MQADTYTNGQESTRKGETSVAPSSDATTTGNVQFGTPLFSFAGSSSFGLPANQMPSAFPFLDALDGSDATASTTLEPSSADQAHTAAPPQKPSTHTHNNNTVGAAELNSMFTKFATDANAQGSSGFLSESAGTNPATRQATQSGKGSPFHSNLPLSPSSCASSQQHQFPSGTPSPSAQAYTGTSAGGMSPLPPNPSSLSPGTLDLPVQMGGYTMQQLFVPWTPMPANTVASMAHTTPTPEMLSGDRARGVTSAARPVAVAALPPAASATNSLVRRNVYVSGLPSHFRSNDLRELCQPFGRIEASKLCVDNNSTPTKGYGFALFFDETSAAACIVGLNGRQVCGRTLQARYADIAATPKPVTQNGGGGAGNHNSQGSAASGRANSGMSGGRPSRHASSQQQSPCPSGNVQLATPQSLSISPVTPSMMPSPQPMLYTTSLPGQGMGGNVMWLSSAPSQQQQQQPQMQQPYVMLPQGPVPVMMNTAGMPTAAPVSTPNFVYVMDPNTQQVQLCQYPSYQPQAGMMDMNGGAIHFLPTN